MNDSFKIGVAVCTLMQDVFNDFTAQRAASQTKAKRLAQIMEPFGKIVFPGLVEDQTTARSARDLFRREGVGIIVYAALSYVKSSVCLELLQRVGVPVLIWNTQFQPKAPEKAGFDAMWTDSGMAGLPGTVHALLRCGVRFGFVTGHVEDTEALSQIEGYIEAARSLQSLRRARVATVGHVYEGMTDLMTDLEDLRIALGPLAVPVDAFRIPKALGSVSDSDAQSLVAKDRDRYGNVEAAEKALLGSARLALAMEQVLCQEEAASGVAILDQIWLHDPHIGVVATYGYMHLNRKGIPCVCEVDVPTTVSQIILEQIAGPSMLGEFYDMDFERDAILICHDSNGNPTLARTQKDVDLIEAPLYVGTQGPGIACEFACPPGDVTLLGLTKMSNRWRFVLAEGKSVPAPQRPMGAPYLLFQHESKTLRQFCRDWCTSGVGHHMGLAYGRASETLVKLARFVGLEVESV